MWIGALLLNAGAAEPTAEEIPWWLGRPVADVQFSAPEGGLPQESLEPLLRVAEGEPLDPYAIALDLVTLFQVNEFSAVEADIQEWVILDSDGDPVPAVVLTYVVYPAPRIARIRVQDNREFRDQVLLAESGLTRDQVFYAEIDGPTAEQRLQSWLAGQGYTDARVQVRSTEPEPGEIHVVIAVEEGEPNKVQRLTFTGDLDGVATERQLRRWARRRGVAEGRPIAPEAVMDAQEAIREHLGTFEGGWFRPRTAWIEARVTPLAIRSAEGVRITYAIEPGSRLELDVDGLGFNGSRTAEEALGIDHRLRITRGFLDQADDRLVASLQERGWLAAEARVEHEEDPDGREQVLRIEVTRNGRHRIGGFLEIVDFDFELTDVPEARERDRESRELQAVFDQASPDILRRDFYTAEEMEVGLAAAKQYYVDRGYLDAELEVLDPELVPRTSMGNVWRAVAGTDPSVEVTPRVRVVRGPVTTLRSLEVQGAASDIDLAFVEEAREQRVGEPFSPQQLDVLARRVVEAHREAGYLEADARVQHVVSGPQERVSTIVVQPGAKLLLRSVVIRGTRHTQPAFVQNEVGHVALGQPITSGALEQIRADLYELGIFRSVDLRLLGDEEARDLVVTLDERPRWEFELGPGVSTDQGFRTIGRVTRYNLFGTAQRLEAVGQIGFEFRSSNVTDWVPDLANPEWRGAVSYTAPRFPLDRTSVVFDLLLRERRQERTWQMDRTGGGAALQAQLGRTQLRGGARVEARRLNTLEAGALLPGEPWTALLGDDPVLPAPDEDFRQPWRWQESLTGLVVYDQRDDRLSPRKGLLLSWNGEWVPGLPWDDLFADQAPASFVKNDLRFSQYTPLWGFTLHLAVSGGYIHSLAGVPPLEDRYRLGGTGSFRGFVRDAVGPHNISPRRQVDWPRALGPVIDYALRDEPERWTPTGGDAMGVGTIELLMPLPALGLSGWDGYAFEVFSDFGNAWLVGDQQATSGTRAYRDDVPLVRYSVGIGGRVATPIGPLQVDVAFNPQVLGPKSAEQKLLLVDGWREPPVRAHLALGALF